MADDVTKLTEEVNPLLQRPEISERLKYEQARQQIKEMPTDSPEQRQIKRRLGRSLVGPSGMTRGERASMIATSIFGGLEGASENIRQALGGRGDPMGAAQRTEMLKNRIMGPAQRRLAMQQEQRKPKKLREMSDTTIKQLAQGKQIPSEIAKIQAWMDVPGMSGRPWTELMGPIKGRAQQIGGQVFDWSKAAAEFEGRLKPVQQMYGRFMEGGVLRKEDEIKYEKQFPQITDRPEIAKFKLEVVNGLVSRYYNTLVGVFGEQGYQMAGFDKVKDLDKEIVIMEDEAGNKYRIPKDMVKSAPSDWAVSKEKFSENIKGRQQEQEEEEKTFQTVDGASFKLVD